MKNIIRKTHENKLELTIDLSKTQGPSKSGKRSSLLQSLHSHTECSGGRRKYKEEKTMIKINPQPESKPRLGLEELGFTQKAFTGFLINAGVLSPGDTVVRWNIDKDFLAFDVKEKL